MDECVKTLCAWRDTRKKLTGLSTKGPNGFIANKTICCLETNYMLTMKEVLVIHTCYMARSPHICKPPESPASFSVQRRTICSHNFRSQASCLASSCSTPT